MADWQDLKEGDFVRLIDGRDRTTYFILSRYSPDMLLLKEVGNMHSGLPTTADKVRKLSAVEVLAVWEWLESCRRSRSAI